MKIRKWNGVQNQDLFADLIYPKDAAEGTVRLVLRAPSGRVKENVLDFNLETGLKLFPVSETLVENAPPEAIDDGYFSVSANEAAKIEEAEAA